MNIDPHPKLVDVVSTHSRSLLEWLTSKKKFAEGKVKQIDVF